LLDKKEEEVQQLQQVIADSETSFFAILTPSRRDILNSLFLMMCVVAFRH
jgi:hypothetical protein